ncbi:MAG TPA: hypothetical protein VGK23_07340 [Methanomassiliicoccales archaeon]|jgi:bifunctional DNA-binding transcriptional regulator/antitoxin component of YhaV-PrlF toxin-antitoxin module
MEKLKTTTVTTGLRICLGTEVTDYLEIQEGDSVDLVKDDKGNVLIVPLRRQPVSS